VLDHPVRDAAEDTGDHPRKQLSDDVTIRLERDSSLTASF
jgi:hypothetical protein